MEEPAPDSPPTKASDAPPDRADFEQLLADLAALVVEGPKRQLDQTIEEVLQRLGAFMHIDRCAVFQFTDDGGRCSVTHVWTSCRFPHDDALREHRVDERFPWLVGVLQRREPILIERLDDLPTAASAEQAYLEGLGVRSSILVPMVGGDDVIGAIALDSITVHRRWPPEYIRRLTLIGRMIANTLLRRRAELESLRHLAQLAHATRVTMVGELVASIAHQLKQPLTAIMTNARAALRMLDRADAPSEDEITAIFRDVLDDGRRATELIDQVREFLRTGEPKLAPVDLDRLIRKVVALLEDEAAIQGVTIRLELDTALPSVHAGANAIEQVALNLILNGMQAMTETPAGDRSIVIRSARERDHRVRVSVSDRGAGIDAADVDRVFDAFFTTKPQGMGMGLAVCRSIIEAHGGRLWFEPNEKAGVTFHFTLPYESPMDSAETPR